MVEVRTSNSNPCINFEVWHLDNKLRQQPYPQMLGPLTEYLLKMCATPAEDIEAWLPGPT
jgi:hypothetical protein